MSEGSGRGIAQPGLEALSIDELTQWAPRLPELLRSMGIFAEAHPQMSLAFVCEEAGIDPADVLDAIENAPPRPEPSKSHVNQLEIRGGSDKFGQPEPVQQLIVELGQAIVFVGATGSGKSQVLSDVETLAAGDSPSKRTVLLDGQHPDDVLRWSPIFRPVAQISQGMRFLIDMQVGPFLQMHAAVRGVASPELTQEVIRTGCELCGEPFDATTQLASLSGGQTRALMIADAAVLSSAPIILVDEIENAGIDREQAIRFLVTNNKIALIATHDPLLALRADKRVIMKNGAMQDILCQSEEEGQVRKWLEEQEHELSRLREALRLGVRLTRRS